MYCFIRAFNAGLRYAGLNDINLSYIEVPASERDIWKLAESYGLKRTDPLNTDFTQPVLVCYKNDLNEENAGHAVFCSDIQPFFCFEVATALIGWELLQKEWKKFNFTDLKRLWSNEISRVILNTGEVINLRDATLDGKLRSVRYINEHTSKNF